MTVKAARTSTEELNIADCLPKAATVTSEIETHGGQLRNSSISIIANRNPYAAVDLFTTQTMVLKNGPA